MFLTTPLRTLPSASAPSVCFFFSAFSSSSSALRDSTMLPRFLFTLMTRMRSSCPRSASRFRTGLLDLVPNLHLLGFFAREDHVAFPVFGALEQHIDEIAGLDRHLAALV